MAKTLPPAEAPPVSESLRETISQFFPTRRQLFGLLLGYFALHVLIRTALSPSADLDESEQLILTQRLRWGYGSDPPLYAWLQMGVFSIFRPSIFGLALLKDTLLFCTYAFTYFNARLITRSHAGGVAAAISLLFMPQVAWESQRDLTHSVLSATLAAATLFCFLRLHETKRTSWSLLFGAAAGLGLLSKYNYGFWVVGLVLAALSLPELRARVLDKRSLLALAVCGLLFLPNGLWIAGHRELAFLHAAKLDLRQSSTWAGDVWAGLRNMLVALVSFLGPLAAVYLLVFAKKPKGPPTPAAASTYPRLIARTWLIIVAVLLLLVLCFRATGFRERWFQPILICAPVLAVALVQDRLDPARLKALVALGLAVMLGVTIAIPSRILFGERLKREEPLMRPYRALAAQMRPAIPDATLIIADSLGLGGNLRLAWPDKRVVTPEMPGLFFDRPAHRLLVWDATRHDAPPPLLRHWAQTEARVDLTAARPQYFNATYRFHHQRQMRLGMLLLD